MSAAKASSKAICANARAFFSMKVSINREAAAGSLPKETAVPLALALNELLTNAAMHSAMIVAASLSKWS